MKFELKFNTSRNPAKHSVTTGMFFIEMEHAANVSAWDPELCTIHLKCTDPWHAPDSYRRIEQCHQKELKATKRKSYKEVSEYLREIDKEFAETVTDLSLAQDCTIQLAKIVWDLNVAAVRLVISN